MPLADTARRFKFAPPSQSRSFLNLPGAFEFLLTGSTPRQRLPDDLLPPAGRQVKNIILILIDGWGWKKAFDRSLPFVSHIAREPSTQIHQIDSGFPTTTAAMLPSLYTGQPPAAHGYVEWRHYEQGVGMINILPWRLEADHGQRETLARRGIDPETVLRKGTFFKELKEKGVTGHLVQPDELENSTFNRFIVPPEDATTSYYSNLRRGLDDVTTALALPGDRKLVILYAMKYDHICHLLGPESAGAKEALAETLDTLDDWYLTVAGQHPGTLLTVTADHGQIHVPLTQWFSLPEKAPLLGKYLRRDAAGQFIPLAGSARDRFAYLQPGTEIEAQQAVSRQLEGLADVQLVRDMVTRGYYNSAPPSEAFLRRMGDLCILPHTGCITGWDGAVGKDLGHHGGLSEDEVQIPWIMTALG